MQIKTSKISVYKGINAKELPIKGSGGGGVEAKPAITNGIRYIKAPRRHLGSHIT